MTRRKLIFEECSNCGDKIQDDEKALLIDDDNDLIFCGENCLKEHFEIEIEAIEKEHIQLRSAEDIPIEDFPKYHGLLDLLLNEPDEVWDSEITEEQTPISYFIGEFIQDKEPVFYIAATYMVDDTPAFVYTHFPTRDPNLLHAYRRGQMLYSSVDEGGEEEEALDPDFEEEMIDGLPGQILKEVMENHNPNDIDFEDFPEFEQYKVKTIENPTEVWREIDEMGQAFLIFMAIFDDPEGQLSYITVCLEDDLEGIVPLIGFPTMDSKIVDLCRRGSRVDFEGSESN